MSDDLDLTESSHDWFEVMAAVGRRARAEGLRFEITEAPDGSLLYSVRDDSPSA